MLTPHFFRSKFEAGLTFDEYVRTGSDVQQTNWRSVHGSCRLTEEQSRLVRGFTRRIRVVVSSGIWCGDCVQQCPILERVERTNPEFVSVRFLDRDQHRDLSEPLMICGGLRVPTVVFLNEDFEFVSLLGDRTLSRYRALAARTLGSSCPVPGAPVAAAEFEALVQDWLGEFERVHLLLRMSPKLQARHES